MVWFFLILIISFFGYATDKKPPKNLDQLFKQITKDQVDQEPELKKRELEFLKKRNQQRALLEKAKADLKNEEKIMVTLQARFEEQEKILSGLEERLRMGYGGFRRAFWFG